MQKIHKHLLQVLGGYRKRLKRKNLLKGFTLVELIVVIVILAILAAILIPGLLKWIDQAKNKKYELEAREISQAAEAALAKAYAQGKELIEPGRWVDVTELKSDIEDLTGATVNGIEIYGSSTGSISGYKIDFKSDGVPITAELSPDTGNRWIIDGSSDGNGDELDKYDNDTNLNIREANAIAKAAKKAMAKVYADDSVYIQEVYHGALEYTTTPGVGYSKGNFMDLPIFVDELKKLINVDGITSIYLFGKGWNGDNGTDGIYYKPWDGSIDGFEMRFESSDGANIYAYYMGGTEIINNGPRHVPTDGWEITKKS